jgi:sugar phosphate isomerase/epimerase
MTTATFILSAFGDEIADELAEQLHLLRDLRVGYLELRGAWGQNVLNMDDDTAAAVRWRCAEFGVVVSCIGSPLGKSPIADPLEREMSNLERIFRVAEVVGTRRVRVFSFYPPDTRTNAGYDDYVAEATARLAQMADAARREGFTLLLENEKEIVGDTPERCHAILSAVDSPHLRFAWDPANFVQVGVAQPMEHGWSLLGPYVTHVHVKDAHLTDGSVCAAGEGDGQVGELLTALRDGGYQGFLALEPHLVVAGRSGGFTGPGGMTYAVSTLRRLMASLDCVEAEKEGSS